MVDKRPVEKETPLYSWQLEAARALEGHCGVLSAPTGSGKTKVAYLWAGMIDEEDRVLPLDGREKIIFTAPIKALSNERYMELVNLGFDVGIETGDFKKNTGATVICCTQEIYALKYAGHDGLKVVIDEFHYIFEESERSRAYIDGIRHTHPAVPILVMSATFGQPEEVRQYLEHTARRPFVLYQSQWRATELSWQQEPLTAREIHDALVFAFSQRGAQQVADLIADERQDFDKARKARLRDLAWILEVPTIRRCMYKGVGVYHGSLLPKEKLFVERAYRERILDVVVGTDALALGVNLPAERVVFAQLVRYHDRRALSRIAFLQMAGRAGRKGLFDRGIVTWLHDSPVESRGIDTGQVFSALCSMPVEPARVELRPDYGAILKHRSTAENEAEIVARGSLPVVKEPEVLETIKLVLSAIDEECVARAPQSHQQFRLLLGDIWYSEMGLEQNLIMGELFLHGVGGPGASEYTHPNGLIAAELLLPWERNMLQALLRVKRFNNSLPDSLKLQGMAAVEEAIMEIDPTVFGFEDKIDEMNATQVELPKFQRRLHSPSRHSPVFRRKKRLVSPRAKKETVKKENIPSDDETPKSKKKSRPRRRRRNRRPNLN